ncbi:Phytanoyl-CoA dioxygenase, partial [Zea mays]
MPTVPPPLPQPLLVRLVAYAFYDDHYRCNPPHDAIVRYAVQLFDIRGEPRPYFILEIVTGAHIPLYSMAEQDGNAGQRPPDSVPKGGSDEVVVFFVQIVSIANGTVNPGQNKIRMVIVLICVCSELSDLSICCEWEMGIIGSNSYSNRDSNEPAQLAAEYRGQGFQTLKLKVGKNLNSDIEVQKAIRLVHPDCSFILDANEGYTRNQAIEVLDRLNGERAMERQRARGLSWVGLEGSANGQWWISSIGKTLDEGISFHRVGSRQWQDYLLLHGQRMTSGHMLVMLMLLQCHVAWGALLATRPLLFACFYFTVYIIFHVMNVLSLHELDPVFKKFSFSESVASLFSSLGYKRPAVIQSMYIFKQPGIGGEVVPHQDNTFLYTEPRTCTGLWLALEDATINNGCLWAILGSHKKGLVRRMVRDENGTHFDRPSPVYDQKEFVPLEVKSGALVVIHGDLIHQSFENLSPASRHAFSLHVVDTEGCKWSEDNWLVHIHN